MKSLAVQPRCLFLVATPIGNLQDITLRALQVLGAVDLVAAEDTRRTARLLSAHGIGTRMISYREQNHRRAAEQVFGVLESGGSVALVSDAGTPALSDPGQRLVQEAAERGYAIVSLPGPSAITAAVSASGLFRRRFSFFGFPPRQESALSKWAQGLATEGGTLVFFESPLRLGRTLAALARVMGDRRAVVAKEISKIHEQFDRGKLSELAGRYTSGTRGEVTVVVEGGEAESLADKTPDESWKEMALAIRRGERLAPGRLSELVAKAGGFDRRAVYRWLLDLEGEGNSNGS